jgi:predicted Rdx family selenoprotein
MNLSMSPVFCFTRTFNIQKDANGHLFWAKKRDFIIPSEEELKKMVLPENVSFRIHF